MSSALLLLATMLLGREALRRRDGVLIAISIFIAGHFTIRSVMLGAGLDVPYPEYLFRADSGTVWLRTDTLITLWIFLLLLLTRLMHGRRTLNADEAPKAALKPIPLFPLMAGVLLFTGALLVKHGGFAATQQYVRLGDGGSGGTGIYLVPPSILLVVSIASWNSRAPHRMRAAILGVVCSAGAFFVLGSRTPIVVAVITLAVCSFLRHRRSSGSAGRSIALMIVLAVGIPALAVGLRTARDAALTQSTTATAPQNGFSTIARAINANYYDALALVVRDKGRLYGERSVQGFATNYQTLVPHALWQGKPTFVSVGKWLRREYEPQRINGWPVGAPGDWYLALGLLGLPIGAAITILAAGALRGWSRRLAPDAALEVALFWGFVVLPGGIDEELISRLVVWVVLPFTYTLLVRGPRSGASCHEHEVDHRTPVTVSAPA